MIAVKEGLVNALIHFDPSEGRDIIIQVRDDNLIISSPGSMNLGEGRSYPQNIARNPKLAEFMKKIGCANLKGRGTGIMRFSYKGTGLVPVIREHGSQFQVVLPSIEPGRIEPQSKVADIFISIKKRPGLSVSELSSETRMSSYELRKILSTMEADGHLFTLGLGSNKMIFLCDPNKGSDLRTAS